MEQGLYGSLPPDKWKGGDAKYTVNSPTHMKLEKSKSNAPIQPGGQVRPGEWPQAMHISFSTPTSIPLLHPLPRNNRTAAGYQPSYNLDLSRK
jgi:hypothetical protein